MHQRVVPFAGFHDDVATTTTVATGRAAAGDKFLPAEGHAAVAPVPGLDATHCFVNKHAVYLIVQASRLIRPEFERPRESGFAKPNFGPFSVQVSPEQRV